jgi:hypothetical protein
MNNLLTELKTTSIGHAGPETDTNTRPENYHKSHHISGNKKNLTIEIKGC